MDKSTTLYVNLPNGCQVKATLSHQEEVHPTPSEPLRSRELTVTELEAFAADLANKNYSLKSQL